MTRRLLLLLPLGALFGCASADLPKRTQLQIREFQTRFYETSDVKMVMKAVANVMQDDGYMINDANAELGLITGRKETDVETVGGKVWRTLFFMYGATSEKTAIIEATGNVSAFGSQTKVRMNFLFKLLNNKGGLKKTQMIHDAKFYQDFFALVDKAVFLEKEKVG